MGMCNSQPEPLPPPQKTLKELVKEFTRTINRLRRDFAREINKLETSNKKITSDMKNMMKKGEPRNQIKIIAQNLVKNQNMIQKYKKLDAQMSDVLFQLNTAATTDTLVKVMTSMGDVMKQSNEAMDPKTIALAIERFNMEVEKQNLTAAHNFLSENIQDAMDDGDADIDDEEVNKLVMRMEKEVNGEGGDGGGDAMKDNNQKIDDFDAQLKALKD